MPTGVSGPFSDSILKKIQEEARNKVREKTPGISERELRRLTSFENLRISFTDTNHDTKMKLLITLSETTWRELSSKANDKTKPYPIDFSDPDPNDNTAKDSLTLLGAWLSTLETIMEKVLSKKDLTPAKRSSVAFDTGYPAMDAILSNENRLWQDLHTWARLSAPNPPVPPSLNIAIPKGPDEATEEALNYAIAIFVLLSLQPSILNPTTDPPPHDPKRLVPYDDNQRFWLALHLRRIANELAKK